MKIRELPEDIQKLAIANQIAQGNPENLEIDVGKDYNQGNFTWDKSNEEYDFWYLIYNNEFKKARVLLNISNENSSEIITYTEEEVKDLVSKAIEFGQNNSNYRLSVNSFLKLYKKKFHKGKG